MELRLLKQIELDALREVVIGHESWETFDVSRIETENSVYFSMTLRKLDSLFVNTWIPTEVDLKEYEKSFAQDTSIAAYEDGLLVGVAIGDVVEWNKTFWIREFHVRKNFHRRGIGWLMMEKMVDIARERGMRIVALETQNTNVPAIRFYQAMGFSVDSLDVSFYTNDDYEKGEMAIFMKRKLI